MLKFGVKVQSASEPVDDTAGGKLMETVFSAFAQFDNDIRGERTKNGMLEKIRQGQWAWKAPIGYKNTSAGMLVDTERAQLIKQAFETYSKGGYTVKAITIKVNRWGLRTEKGKKITPQTLTKIFSNKIYYGVLDVWGEEHQGVHEPLVSKELFHNVNSIRLGKSRTANIPHLRNNNDFPLKNILLCTQCGKHITGSKSTGRKERYAYYHCVCGAVRVRKELVEENFYKYLKSIQPRKDLMKLFEMLLIGVWKKKRNDSTSALDKLDRDIIALRSVKEKTLK